MKRILSLALLVLFSLFAQAQPLQQSAITAINSTPTATCSAGSCVMFDMKGQGTASVQVSGTYTASGGLSLQATTDGTTWVTVGGSGTFRRLSTGVSTATITSAEQGVYQLSGDCVGAYACRITALGAVTGSATVSVLTSPAAAGGVANISGGAGDASASNQVAGNASLTSIDGKMVAGAGAVSAATQRVVAATDSPDVAALGAVADAAATQGSTGSVSAKLRTVTAQLNTGNTSLAAIDAGVPAALGQAVAASSMPVVLPLLQNAVNTQGSTTSGQSGALVQGAVTTAAPTYTTGQTSPLSLDTSGQLRITGTVSAGGVAQGSTTSGQTGGLIQGAVTTAAPTYTTAQTSPLSLDTSGNLRVNVVTGGAGGGNVTGGTAHDAVGTSVNPVLVGGYSSAAAPTNVSADGDVTRLWLLRSGATVNQPSFGGVLASANSGTNDTGTQRVTIATNDTLMSTINTSLGTINTSINASNAQLPTALGQTTMAASLSTAVASNQSAVALWGHGATAAAVPANVTAIGARAGANSVNVAQGSATVAVNVSTATTTQLVALSGSTQIYVTGLAVIAGGTGNITLVYGTGASCGTGTTSLSGPIPLIANAGFTLGSGLGPVLVVPAGQALCITTSASVQMSGFVTYTQF